MVIFGGKRAEGRTTHANGPNSRALKFESFICEQCNSSKTQKSDLAYENYINEARTIKDEGDLIKFSQAELVKINGLHIFRYFAKLLGCHLSDINAPIPRRLINFVSNNVDQNCIWLQVRRDPVYTHIIDSFESDDISYTAHGGVAVTLNKDTGHLSRIFSSYSINSIQFIFHIQIFWWEAFEIALIHGDFMEFCRKSVENARCNPEAQQDLWSLGLE